jgi:3-dehydroquinate synthetase/predicted NBD/HSP70 family sugar kinase
MNAPEPVVVFDVGGTWLRSAVLDGEDGLRSHRIRPTPSGPGPAGEDGLELLVRALAAEARRLASRHRAEAAAVSLGAAIDHRTGLVLGSGPLWGPGDDLQLDLAGVLAEAAPELRWLVVNDITANAFALACRPENSELVRLAAVTVGTGVGMRTIEVAGRRVVTGPDSGLQGEIGHLPAAFCFDGETIELPCDCGAVGHLGACSSGRGLERMLGLLAAEGEPWLGGRETLQEQFRGALQRGRPRARRLLDAITLPLAVALLHVMTVDPEVDRLFLAGGLPFALGGAYMDSLGGHMDAIGLYGSAGSPRDRLALVEPDWEIGLVGAGRLARAERPPAGRRRWSVPGDRPQPYEVLLADDLLDPCRPTFRAALGLGRAGSHRRLLICDRRVWSLFAERVATVLQGGPGHLALETVLLEEGESAKTLPTVQRVVEAFEDFGLLRRSEPVIALGGGALLDVVGFAASIYRRGVPYVRVPTTLLAMIDAAIGVKTGINHNGAKSRLGSYYPATRVLIDPAFLQTLDLRQYRSGLAESAKIALVADPVLFDLLEGAGAALGEGAAEEAVELEVIQRSVTAMLGQLAGNLREERLERLVDIGHSFSPAIELRLAPSLLHGECVAIDLALTVVLSRARGLLEPAGAERILAVLASLGLALSHPQITPELLWAGVLDTCRHRDGLQRIPLLRDVGEAVFVNDVGPDELACALRSLQVPEPAQRA